MNNQVSKIVYTQEQIQQKVLELSSQLDSYYNNEVPVLLGILKGSYHFLSDLSRGMKIHHTVDFMSVSSYENTNSTGSIKILSEPRHSIEGKHVLIVEDILDTGITLSQLLPHLLKKNPKSIKIITLLQKPTKIQTDVKADWVGFDLDPPEFVIGYGLDYNELFRNLPYIAVPTQETIEKYNV